MVSGKATEAKYARISRVSHTSNEETAPAVVGELVIDLDSSSSVDAPSCSTPAEAKEAAKERRALREARVLLVAAGACLASYPVALRGFYTQRGLKLSPTYISTARFSVMAILVGLLRLVRWQSYERCEGPKPPKRTRRLKNAATELAFIDFGANLLSTLGLSMVPAVAGEILMATIHLFVPLLSLCPCIVRHPQPVGLRTWCGCILAFAAAIAVSVLGKGISIKQLKNGDTRELLQGPVALIAAAAMYGLGRVRLMSYLQRGKLDSETLMGERVVKMLAISAFSLFLDLIVGGASPLSLLAFRAPLLAVRALSPRLPRPLTHSPLVAPSPPLVASTSRPRPPRRP